MLTTTEYLHLINNTVDQGKSAGTGRTGHFSIPRKWRARPLLWNGFRRCWEIRSSKKVIDQAIPNMKNAYPAILQLGFLHITSGDVENATKTWLGLDVLEKSHPFNLLRQGMLHLVADEFIEAKNALERGMAENSELPEINASIRQVVKKNRRYFIQIRFE